MSHEAYCQGAEWRPRKRQDQPGACGACGTPLTGRNRWFCPSRYGEQHRDSCRESYMTNHWWSEARAATILRDQHTCQICGYHAQDDRGLGVNHLVARNGRGYQVGCHNHLKNLQTLCHTCHAVTTAAQRKVRALEAAKARRLAQEQHDRDKLDRWTHQARLEPDEAPA